MELELGVEPEPAQVRGKVDPGEPEVELPSPERPEIHSGVGFGSGELLEVLGEGVLGRQ